MASSREIFVNRIKAGSARPASRGKTWRRGSVGAIIQESSVGYWVTVRGLDGPALRTGTISRTFSWIRPTNGMIRRKFDWINRMPTSSRSNRLSGGAAITVNNPITVGAGNYLTLSSGGDIDIGIALVLLAEFHDDQPVVAQVDALYMETAWLPRISGWTTPSQLQPNSAPVSGSANYGSALRPGPYVSASSASASQVSSA